MQKRFVKEWLDRLERSIVAVRIFYARLRCVHGQISRHGSAKKWIFRWARRVRGEQAFRFPAPGASRREAIEHGGKRIEGETTCVRSERRWNWHVERVVHARPIGCQTRCCDLWGRRRLEQRL